MFLVGFFFFFIKNSCYKYNKHFVLHASVLFLSFVLLLHHTELNQSEVSKMRANDFWAVAPLGGKRIKHILLNFFFNYHVVLPDICLI